MKKNKKLIICIISTLLTSTINAEDIRLVVGYVDSLNIEHKESYGIEASWHSDDRGNGYAYGFTIAGMGLPTGEGNYGTIELELLKRINHKIEPFVTAGAAYQRYKNGDDSRGWVVGLGARYVWCSGYEIQGKLQHHKLKYNSSQASTASQDDTEIGNNTATFGVGYRF